MPLQQFIFDGERETPQELARRRAIAESMLQRGTGGIASNMGEGIAQFGQALAGRIGASMADAKLRKNQGAARKGMGSLFDSGGGMPSVAPDVLAGRKGTDALPGGAKALVPGIQATAKALGIDPADLATAISYETAGTFDPAKKGPTTKWGQHKGLIQFGEPQAKQYGVDWNDPAGSQLGENGAIAKYLRNAGVKPGMGMMDVYSAINAGRVGRSGASDAAAGGAPGTVADKVNSQMAGHRAKAMAMLAPSQAAAPMPAGPQPASNADYFAQFRDAIPPMAKSMVPPAMLAPFNQASQAQPPAPQQAPQPVPASAPPPQMMPPQAQMQQQQPMTAYQRMMRQSLEKDGGMDDPRNRPIAQSIGAGRPMPGAQGGFPGRPGLGGGQPLQNLQQPSNSQQMAAPGGGGKVSEFQRFISGPEFAWLEPPQQKFVMDEYERELQRANPERVKPMEVGGRLVDPMTGKVIFEPPPEMPDEMKRIQLEKAKIELEQARHPDARQRLGLNPIYGRRNGQQIIMQPSESGGLVEAPLPDGVTLEPGTGKIDLGTSWGITDRGGNVIQQIPKDLAGEAAAKTQGAAQGEAAGAAPPAAITARQTIAKIDELLNDKNLGAVSGIESYQPDWLSAAGDKVAGRDAGTTLDLRRRVEQLKGSAFLEAYTGLKGGGAITEVEGKKAEDAIARLNTAQTDGSYKQALKDFRDAVAVGYAKLEARSGGRAAPLNPSSSPELSPSAVPGMDPDGWTTLPNGIRIRQKAQ